MAFASQVSTGSDTFRRNRADMLALVERLRELEARAVTASEKRRDRFNERGQITPRERLARLLDPGMPFLQMHSMAGYLRDSDDPDKTEPGSSIICGIGFVAGVRAMIWVDDSGIKAGAVRDTTLLAILSIQDVALRQQLLGEERPRFTGLLAWRGLVPMQALPAHLRMAEGEAIGTNWVGPGGHVITYPVRGGTLMNVVGILERDDWRSESWTEPGSTEELLRDFTGWHADVQTLMTAIAEPFKWALLSRAPRSGWAQGRVCLLGDAAHPTLPFLAQGANMAIEDAAVMARCLDESWRPSGEAGECADATEAGESGESPDSVSPSPPDPLTAALRRFETLRWQRTADIVNRSADNATRFHNPRLADPAYAEAYIDSEWDSEKVRHRYDWLFAYDALSG